jgi:hypothetical protein
MSKMTPWYPRHTQPVRNGHYECAVLVTSSAPQILFDLEWDGIGFLVSCPMVVTHWRGLAADPGGSGE